MLLLLITILEQKEADGMKDKEKKKLKDGKLFKFAKEKFPELLGQGLEIFGDLTGRDSIENLGSWIQDKVNPTPETLEDLNKAKELDLQELDLYLKDVANARNMQVEALQQDDKFSKRFIYFLALFWSIIAGFYLFFVTFAKVANEHMADIILGFVLGSIISTIIKFFFGSSMGSKQKTDILSKK